MDFVLFLSLILLLNSAGRFECSGVDDETVSTPFLSLTKVISADSSTEIPPKSTKEIIEKREVTSWESSSSDIESTKNRVPLEVDVLTVYPIDEKLKLNRTADAEEEGNSRKPLIIDLGNIPSIRVRRSDSNKFTESMMADKDELAEEDEYEDSSSKMDEDPTIQKSAEDLANIREERKLESDEILGGVEQDHGRMFSDWYRHRSFAERRYWSSEENQQPRRHFITVPVFPGK